MTIFVGLVMYSLFFAIPSIFGQELTLQNDSSTDNQFGLGDMVGWMEYPECAISVLTPKPHELPFELTSVEVLFAAQFGTLNNQQTSVMLSMQYLEKDAMPLHPGNWAWSPTVYNITVSASSLNSLPLHQAEGQPGSLVIEEGAVAIWICTPDPSLAKWPKKLIDVSGIVLHSASSSKGTFLYDGKNVTSIPSPIGEVQPGAWVIHALGHVNQAITESKNHSAISVEQEVLQPENLQEVKNSQVKIDASDTPTQKEGPLDLAQKNTTHSHMPNQKQVDSERKVASQSHSLTLTHVTPNQVSDTSQTISFLGSGFQKGATVYIGGLLCGEIQVVNEGAILAKIPTALPIGTHDIVVKNMDGTTVTSQGGLVMVSTGCQHLKTSKNRWVLFLMWVLLWFRRNPNVDNRRKSTVL